jgi:hypothetical protein
VAAPNALTFHALGRSGLVLAGLLLLGVGIGNAIAGHTKIAQYEEVLRATAPSGPANPAALFPKASERDERHELAQAKLAFYELLLTVGQVLSALGFTLLAVGVVRLLRAPRAPRIDFRTPGV